MLTPVKKFAAKSKTLIVLHRIYDNWRRKRAFKAGNTVSFYGSTHAKLTLGESVAYINKVYDEYLKYSGLSAEMFRGKRILEVGPGDNFGVALRFLAAGAAQVVCLDKFYSERSLEQQTNIYRSLRRELSPQEVQAFDSSIRLDNAIELDPDRVSYIYGHGIEEADYILERESFHFILSRAVIHNVYDIDTGMQAMDRLLVPGGYMIHKIDLSDEKMFSSRGMHPLTFLTLSERVYRLMAADSGKPNRKLINYYRQKMSELGYDAKIFVTSILGAGQLIPHKEGIELGVDYSERTLDLITEIRPRLAPPYDNLSDPDLAATGIFLVALKRDKQ